MRWALTVSAAVLGVMLGPAGQAAAEFRALKLTADAAQQELAELRGAKEAERQARGEGGGVSARKNRH